MNGTQETQYRTLDKFDRSLASLDGIPGVSRTAATTVVDTKTLVGDVSTFIVQTYRQRDEGTSETRETIFLQHVDANGTTRIVIPPKVVKVILRQHDALTDRSRAKGAAAAAETRKARGIVPGFLKHRKKK